MSQQWESGGEGSKTTHPLSLAASQATFRDKGVACDVASDIYVSKLSLALARATISYLDAASACESDTHFTDLSLASLQATFS